jgi:Beta-lactamase.
VQTRVAERLGLRSTYIYCDPADRHPVSPLSGRRAVHVPRALTSFQADNGIVTTSRESQIFACGFFEGYLCNKRVLPRWRLMFFPTEFGTGIMKVQAPWWWYFPYRMTFQPQRLLRPPRCIGHFGFGESICFYAPDLGVYVAGTVNQLSDLARGIVFAVRGAEEMARGIRQARMAPLREEHRARPHPAE